MPAGWHFNRKLKNSGSLQSTLGQVAPIRFEGNAVKLPLMDTSQLWMPTYNGQVLICKQFYIGCMGKNFSITDLQKNIILTLNLYITRRA